MGDALISVVLLQHETSVGHPTHQAGCFLKASGHRLQAGAVGGQTGFLPGEVAHGSSDQMGRSAKPSMTSPAVMSQNIGTTTCSDVPPSSKW